MFVTKLEAELLICLLQYFFIFFCNKNMTTNNFDNQQLTEDIKSTTLYINYKDDQWSPNNICGKKYYHHNQLFALRNVDASKIPPICKQTKLSCLPAIDLMPAFARNFMTNDNNNTTAATTQNRHNFRRKTNSQYNTKSNGKCRLRKSLLDKYLIKILTILAYNEKRTNLKLHQDIKLNLSSNAWRPSIINASSLECSDNEQLYKTVRSILNKLTADNFHILLEQIKSQNIDTIEKLNGVIELVFEKAIDEPNFSAAYAQLCKQLTTNCFALKSENIAAPFKTKLINKCQQEFERNVADGNSIKAKLMPIQEKLNNCTDDNLKIYYRLELIEEEQKLRRRSVCTVRFIGELYRMDMLTASIMRFCIKTLLDSRSEEKLECLCKLLTTVGKKLETTTNDEMFDKKSCVDLTIYFQEMNQMICQKDKSCKISLRMK